MTDFTPFPTDCFPAFVQKFVVDQSRSIGCDESVVALPALAVLASTIGPTRRIRLKRTWTEPAILWTAVVAESGAGTSPALSATLETLRESEWAAEEQLIHDARKAGRSDDEILAMCETPARSLVGDVSTPQLVDLLVRNRRGLLMCQDQLDGWMSLFSRTSARARSDQARWLQFHSGNLLMVERHKRVPIELLDPAVSVTGCVEPRDLVDRYKRKGMSDGLFGRLLFAYPPTKPLQWPDGEIDEQVVNDFDALVYRLQSSWAEGDGPQYVELTPEAKTLLIDYANELGPDFHDEPCSLRAVGTRLASHAARLALVLHLTRCAASTLEPTESGRQASREKLDWKTCDVTSVRHAITLARWFASEARRVHALMPANQPPKEAREQLLDWLTHRPRITPRDLCRDNRRYPTTDAARAALQELVQLGHGDWITEPAGEKGGRPARIFVLTGAELEADELGVRSSERGTEENSSPSSPSLPSAQPSGLIAQRSSADITPETPEETRTIERQTDSEPTADETSSVPRSELRDPSLPSVLQILNERPTPALQPASSGRSFLPQHSALIAEHSAASPAFELLRTLESADESPIGLATSHVQLPTKPSATMSRAEKKRQRKQGKVK